MPSELPTLKSTRLDTVTLPVAKCDPRKEPERRFSYIDISAVDQNAKEIASANDLLGRDAPSRARQILQRGDVLVSTVRPNLNAVAQVGAEHGNSIASTGFCVLRPSPTELDNRFLFHWVRTPEFVDEMVQLASGASYPAVSDRIVKNSLIPLPPFELQLRIAAALDAADGLRHKCRQALDKLDSLAHSIFVEMFGDPSDGTGDWSVLANLVRPGDKINYGVVQPGDHHPDGVPMIRVGDLVGGAVDHSSIKLIAPDIDAKYLRSRLIGDEVLVSCVGTTGTVALASAAESGWNIARAVARVPLSTAVRREYVAAFLAGPFAQRYFKNELRTVSQPTLNIKQIKSAPIRVPDITEQDKFAERLDCIARLRVDHQQQAAELEALFASLQQRAFRGDL